MVITIHGPNTAIANHRSNPSLSMDLVLSNYYRNADRHVGVEITTASIKAGSHTPPFEVFAWLAYGSNTSSTHYSETFLFHKTADQASWADGAYKLASPVKLEGPDPGTQSVFVVIGLAGVCLCTSDKTSAPSVLPVYGYNITASIPRIKPYFWRMQYDKDPSVTTGELDWHLVRPFYICKTIDGQKGWCSCEDETKLVYDEHGDEL